MHSPAQHQWEQIWPLVLPGRPATPAVGPAVIPAHFRCRTCGLEGRRIARDGDDHPKLILLDLKMPKVDGIEVLQRIKSDERLRVIPVVVMTSSNEQPDIIESYRLGVNSYVVKPVEFGAFAEAVAKIGMYWMMVNRGLRT